MWVREGEYGVKWGEGWAGNNHSEERKTNPKTPDKKIIEKTWCCNNTSIEAESEQHHVQILLQFVIKIDTEKEEELELEFENRTAEVDIKGTRVHGYMPVTDEGVTDNKWKKKVGEMEQRNLDENLLEMGENQYSWMMDRQYQVECLSH